MRSVVYVTVGCLSVRISRPSTAAAACGWFAGACRSITGTRRRRSAANAGSVVLRAEDEAQHRLIQLYKLSADFSSLYNVLENTRNH